MKILLLLTLMLLSCTSPTNVRVAYHTPGLTYVDCERASKDVDYTCNMIPTGAAYTKQVIPISPTNPTAWLWFKTESRIADCEWVDHERSWYQSDLHCEERVE